MKITDLLTRERINLNLQSNNKEDVIRELANLHYNTNTVSDLEGYIGAIKERENISSTGLEEGIAIPHAKTKFVLKPALAMGKSINGIDYDSLDGEKSTIFFMIAAPENATDEHVETLAKLTQMLLDEDFKNKLLNANSEEEVLRLIDERENKKEVVISGDDFDLVAVTACPTGIAHTYMAEEALKKAANEMGVKIKVETNGAGGIKNEITSKDIDNAKGVILAIDRNVETDRFNGKPTILTSTKDAIKNAKTLISNVLEGKATPYKTSGNESDNKNEQKGIYKHLMNGVSYMLPLVISGGILIALAFLADTFAGNSNVGSGYGSTSFIAKQLMTIGGAAFGLFIPILGGYIAYSIAGKPALAAGLVAGALSASGGSGFLGALVGGFVAGYITKLIIESFKNLPKSLDGIKAVLLYPVLSVLITGIIVLLLNYPMSIINTSMETFLNNMSGTSKVLLGLILGGMMAIDMGGPINKAAYVFATGTLTGTALSSGGTEVMAAVMAGGMVPPLGIAIATTLFKNKFSSAERESGVSNYVMGLSFITEGAIPFAASDPGRVIPASVIGAAVAGALTMLFSIKIPAPHGGILVMFLSNKFFLYLLAILVGSIITAIMLGIMKKKKM